jgi:heme oxygenase
MYAHCASHEMLLSNYPALQTLVTTRRAELGNDLEVLGQALPAVASRAENCYNHAQCLGFTYVTEGSRLGAVVIARRVQSLGVSTDGLQSMQTSQAMVRARWSKYCEQLGELALTDWDFAAAAAVASFEELKQAHLGSGPVE